MIYHNDKFNQLLSKRLQWIALLLLVLLLLLLLVLYYYYHFLYFCYDCQYFLHYYYYFYDYFTSLLLVLLLLPFNYLVLKILSSSRVHPGTGFVIISTLLFPIGVTPSWILNFASTKLYGGPGLVRWRVFFCF